MSQGFFWSSEAIQYHGTERTRDPPSLWGTAAHPIDVNKGPPVVIVAQTTGERNLTTAMAQTPTHIGRALPKEKLARC